MVKHRKLGLWRRKSGSVAAAVAALMAGVGSLVAAAPELAAQQAAKSPVFTQPTYSSPIALSADNQLVWSVNPDDNSVSVVRTDTNSLSGRSGSVRSHRAWPSPPTTSSRSSPMPPPTA